MWQSLEYKKIIQTGSRVHDFNHCVILLILNILFQSPLRAHFYWSFKHWNSSRSPPWLYGLLLTHSPQVIYLLSWFESHVLDTQIYVQLNISPELQTLKSNCILVRSTWVFFWHLVLNVKTGSLVVLLLLYSSCSNVIQSSKPWWHTTFLHLLYLQNPINHRVVLILSPKNF